MSSTTNQDYINPGQQVEQEVEKPTKEELKTNKKLEKKVAKNLSNDNYRVTKKTSHWLSFKRWAFAFFILTIVFIVVFILMKYLNYYFNFGPMDKETAGQIGSVNWMNPFSNWSWDIKNDFANILVQYEINGENGVRTIQQVVVEGLSWATTGGTNGLEMAVTREAFITNNFANGMLYLATPISLILGFLFVLFHFLFGRTRAKAIINNYISLIQAEAYKLGQADGGFTQRTAASTTGNSGSSPLIINYVNGQPTNAKSQVVVDKDEDLKAAEDKQKSTTTTTTHVTKTVKPTKSEHESESNSKVTKTTHIHKIQPDIDVEEHLWEKADPLPKVKKKRKSYPTLGKNDLIDEVYNDLKGTLTVKQLTNIYDLTFESIIDELDRDPNQDINIFNFGKFNNVVKPGHTGVNPATREKIWIEDKMQLKFAPSLKFKKLMEDADIKQSTKTVKTTTVQTKKG